MAKPKKLKMYDKLWEDHPKVKKMRADSRVQGEVAALQRTLVTIVSLRFPALAELAQQQVQHLHKPDALDLLVQQVTVAPDEKMVRWLLLGLSAA